MRGAELYLRKLVKYVQICDWTGAYGVRSRRSSKYEVQSQKYNIWAFCNEACKIGNREAVIYDSEHYENCLDNTRNRKYVMANSEQWKHYQL